MVTSKQREAAEWYRQFLRDCKRDNLKLADNAPQDVKDAFLALHQNALLVHDEDRLLRKAKKRAEGQQKEGGAL